MTLMEYCSAVYLSPQTTAVPSSPVRTNTEVAGFLVSYIKHSFCHKDVIFIAPLLDG